MKLVCALTALMLAVPVPAAALTPLPGRVVGLYQSADSPARETRTPAVVLGSEAERKSKASAHYEQNRFVEAALGFEGLWRDFPKNDEYLFNAAASRSAAGHNAHVVAYTREYLRNPDLKSGARAADRSEGEAQLRLAMAGVVPVAVTVTAPAGGTGQITLVAEYIPRDSSDLRPELLFPARAGSPIELQLDPGSWTIRAQGPGYIGAEQRIDVAKGAAATVALRLEAAPVAAAEPGGQGHVMTPSEVPPRLVRRLERGFGIAGGVVAVAGIVTLGVGAGKIGKTAKCGDDMSRDCDFEMREGITIRGMGALAFGGGAGLLTGGLTWLVRDPAKRRKAWIGELVVGGAGLVVGAILMPISAKRFNDAINLAKVPDWNDRFQGARHSVDHVMAGLLVGLGAGLITSAATGFAIQKKHGANRVRVDAMAGRGQAGLVVSGRF